MPEGASVYLAINGKEARDLLFLHLRSKIDSLPMMGIGNTFHKLTLIGGVELTSYPADFKFPDIEFEILLEAPTVNAEQELELNKHFQKIEDISIYREKLIAKLEELDLILEKAVPQEVIPINIGGEVPDEIRTAAGLPTQVLKSVSETGRKAEVNATPKTLVKVGGK